MDALEATPRAVPRLAGLELNGASGVAALGPRLFIADTQNSRVVHFDRSSGAAVEFVTSTQHFHLNRVQDVDVDGNGCIYVSEVHPGDASMSPISRVLQFQQDLMTATTLFSGPGADFDQVASPMGIAVAGMCAQEVATNVPVIGA